MWEDHQRMGLFAVAAGGNVEAKTAPRSVMAPISSGGILPRASISSAQARIIGWSSRAPSTSACSSYAAKGWWVVDMNAG